MQQCWHIDYWFPWKEIALILCSYSSLILVILILTHELFICTWVWLGFNHIIAECLHFNMKKQIKSYLIISNIWHICTEDSNIYLWQYMYVANLRNKYEISNRCSNLIVLALALLPLHFPCPPLSSLHPPPFVIQPTTPSCMKHIDVLSHYFFLIVIIDKPNLFIS